MSNAICASFIRNALLQMLRHFWRSSADVTLLRFANIIAGRARPEGMTPQVSFVGADKITDVERNEAVEPKGNRSGSRQISGNCKAARGRYHRAN